MAQTLILWENAYMLMNTLQKIKTKKALFAMSGYFLFFVVLYTILDHLNIGYAEMSRTYGPWLVGVNIILNVVMSAISAFLISATTAQFDFSKKASKGANMSYVSIFFGIFTYGCTPCVISFLAAIGISFSVIALPFAGIPYKFISLGLLLIGLFWILFSINKTVCNVPDKRDDFDIKLDVK